MNDPRLRVIHAAAGAEEKVIQVLDAATIEVRLPAVGSEWRHQVAAITLVDLLARLFPRLLIRGADLVEAHAALPPGPHHLAERLDAARRRGLLPLEPSSATAVTVGIGPSNGGDICVDGDGWHSYVGTSPSQLRGSNQLVPVGPLVAAARAGAHVLARVLADDLGSQRTPITSAYASSLTYRTSADPFEEHAPLLEASLAAVLAGAGSVGGAMSYLLAFVPGLRGELDVVDPQLLEERNFVRAILASRDRSLTGALKAEEVVAALAHQGDLIVRPHPTTMRGFVAGRPREATLPLVLSPVDSVTSRREIQDCLPLDVINAACDGTTATVSGHVTDDGPCVYCLHVGDVLDVEFVRERLIAASLHIDRGLVRQLRAGNAPLQPELLRHIEARASLSAGALEPHDGKTLDELYEAAFLYGESVADAGKSGRIAVASPFLTTLTGFLLGAELLKASSGPAFVPFRLGSRGALGTKYAESILHGPTFGLLTTIERWAGPECLCRSSRRLRLLRSRNGIASRDVAGATALR